MGTTFIKVGPSTDTANVSECSAPAPGMLAHAEKEVFQTEGTIPWPLKKFHAALEAWPGVAPKRGFAVVLTTGGMNPLHLGHVQLLHQAKKRLEVAGYGVVGAWLSPSHDGYLQPKAKSLGTIGLSDYFRLEAARRAVGSDDIVEVGSWEAAQKGRWPDFPIVAKALQDYLATLPEAPRLLQRACESNSDADDEAFIQVFYACGTDHASKCSLYRGLRPERGIGVVVVPRQGEHSGKESAENLVFVASPAAGEIAALSSTKLRAAISKKDYDFVAKAMSPSAADFLLRPGREAYEKFAEDYSMLGVSTISISP